MIALVTGGAGFIGSHIVEHLVRQGHRARIYDNFSAGKRENLSHIPQDQIEVIEADVRDAPRLDHAMHGCDVVFHQAAVVSVPYSVEHPQETHDVNLQGTMNRIDHQQTGPTSDGVRLELQADCYAGVWAHHAANSQDSQGNNFLEPLTEEQIRDGLSAAAAVGDDHIQGEVAGGQVNPETWTHGASEQRQQWFITGYQSGDPASCNTFDTNAL